MVATSQIAQTTLRSVLGQHLLDELLSERDKINAILQEIIDEATAPWGIKVSIVEVKDVEIPSGHAARDGAAGRGRARAAREGDRRRGRVPGVRAAEGRGARDRGPPDRAAAALPADAARARLLAVDDDRLPGADRPDRRRSSSGSTAAPELRAAGRPALGPARRGRAGAGAAARAPARPSSSRRPPSELESCPFCEGREERTPPEMLALPPRSRAGHAGLAGARRPEPLPGLRAPGGRRPLAASTCARSPSSTATSSSSSPRRGGARRGGARGRAGTSTPCINEGRAAGASLPHSHSQLVWLDAEPPVAQAERRIGLPALRLPPARARGGRTRGRAARRARPALPLRRPRAVRVPRRAAGARGERLRPAGSEPRSTWLRTSLAPAGRGAPRPMNALAARVRPLAPRAAAAPDGLRRRSSSAPGSSSTRSRPSRRPKQLQRG